MKQKQERSTANTLSKKQLTLYSSPKLSVLYLSILYTLLFPSQSLANESKTGLFLGYELIEMGLNDFNNFAGELGFRLNTNSQVRFIRMDVVLQERHLKGDEATAVTGPNISGEFKGWEFSYDHFFFDNGFYLSLNWGKFDFNFSHTSLGESYNNSSFTVGTGVGYFEENFLGTESLYFNFSYPIRTMFSHIAQKNLGSSSVNELKTLDNFWMFLGYRF